MRLIFVVLMFYVHRVFAQRTCHSTSTYLQSVLSVSQESANDMTFDNPSTVSNSKCRLNSTCCTSSAESSLISSIGTTYQQRLFNKLNGSITQCLNAPLQSSANTFIGQSKAGTLQALKLVTQGHFTFDESLFNTFYSYLTNGITNMDLNSLQTEFQTMYFKVFLLSFTEGLKNPPYSKEIVTSDVVETCIYTIFNTYFGSSMSTSYNRMKTRFNLYLRFLWATKTGDEVLNTVLSHSLSSDCKNAILRMTHCSHCSLSQDTPSSACSSFCLSTLRGCFVDLAEFGDAFSSYVSVLKVSKDKLEQYDPFATVNLLAGDLTTMVSQTISILATLKIQVDLSCSPGYVDRRKRSISIDLLPHIISKRQTTDLALDAISDHVTCSTDISDMFKRLPEGICGDSSDVTGRDWTCWNGTDVDSYWWEVPDAGRLDQLSNPELYIQANTGLLYKTAIAKLKTVTSDLNKCQGRPRDCGVKFNNFTIPTGTEYNFGDSIQFQSFTEAGFPDPEIVSVVPVPPTASSSPVSSSSSISRATPIPLPSSSSHRLVRPPVTSSKPGISVSSISRATPIPSSSSHRLVRPPVTSSKPGISVSVSTRPMPTSINDPNIGDHIPDPDKAKSSGPALTASITVSLVLMVIVNWLS